MHAKIYFPEDTSKTFLFDSHTTAKEILKKVYEKYSLDDTNEYGLYVVMSNGHGMLLFFFMHSDTFLRV